MLVRVNQTLKKTFHLKSCYKNFSRDYIFLKNYWNFDGIRFLLLDTNRWFDGQQWCGLFKDFCSDIMASPMKKVVSKIFLIYILKFLFPPFLTENCSIILSLKACPKELNQWKPGITDIVHSGNGLRSLCLLILPLETQGLISSISKSPPPDTLSHYVYFLTRRNNISSVFLSHWVLVLIYLEYLG